MPKDKTLQSTKRTQKAGKRAKKDPNAPKRPLSGYMFFGTATRPQIKAENPTATFGQLGKILGERWKNMSDAEKQPWNDKAIKDRLRWEKEVKEYKARGGQYEEDDDENADDE
ncbi:Non-histone chromosomal protein 6 [Polychytrium aggregatum]|uniref:Non-histone chromosomal protein 6 n=1 Tax=Polychytrium aggregatum TaxID=110093 RepID=UPI0022FEDB29|nr:Non-histone chromosomal protein 6 [Polychytrium aggregatum]KAI9206421.1 Non-histone chromosomal protein 6 [Polychytrium aggregatum]